MTKTQLKQLIRECIKEVNESFGVYQGQSIPLRSLYNKIKSDPIIRKNRINVSITEDEDGNTLYDSINLTHDTFEDFFVQISFIGKNKYKVTVPVYGANQYDQTSPSQKEIVTDENGVIRGIYNQIKNEIGR